MLTPRFLSHRTAFGRAVLLALLAVFPLVPEPLLYGQASAVTLATHTSQALTSAVETGTVPGSQPMVVTLTLTPPPDRAAALDRFLTDLADPSSPSYHQWITPKVFASTYGATSAQIAAVTAWAESQGLTVGPPSAGGTRLSLSGSATQVESAFAIGLHTYQLAGASYFATPDQPSLPSAVASLIASIDGLDNLPPGFLFSTVNAAGLSTVSTGDGFTAAAVAIDENSSAILTLASSACASAFVQSQVDQYRLLFRQAAAQGISILASSGCGVSGSFPAALPEVTAISLTGNAGDTDPSLVRPSWQVAPGLPANGLRVEPDLTSPSLAAFAQTIASIIQEAADQAGATSGEPANPSGRQGNLNANLYKLAPIPGLYTQPGDPATAGTWESATGLGRVDLALLAKVYAVGTGSSYTSFTASNYSPVHGQSVTFSASVTSGTGGGTPTGTVSFVASSGTTFGPVTLNSSGSATYTTNQLAGGSVQITAQYSGDSTYAASASTASTINVQAEASQLSAVVSTGNIVGGTYTVAVTDSVTLGQPTGTITVSVLGSNYNGTLVGATATSSSVTITIPATTVGTQTLSINCVGTSNYTCYNPLTTTVTIAKATPVLVYSYLPNPPVSGGNIALTASLAAIGTAPVPTGNVQFYDNTTLLNASTLTNGATSTTGIVTTAASHAISATYTGDANYLSVTSTTPTQTTSTGTTTTSLVSSASTVTAGQTITFTATVTAAALVNSTAPTGTVSFYDSSTLLGKSTLTSGSAVFQTSTLSATTSHSITAVYSGDNNYTGSTSPAVLVGASTVAATTTTAPTISPSAPAYGAVITLSTTVTPTSGGGSPSGTVQFLTGTTVLCTATLAGSVASCNVTTAPAAGTYPVVASYQGSTYFAASSSTASSLVVAPGVATVSASISPTTSIASGTYAVITATVSLPVASVVPPTGTVTATITGVTGAVYSATLPGIAGTTSATVKIPVLAPTAGTYSIAVTCAGNANYGCSTVTIPLVTTGTAKPSSTVLSISPIAPSPGQAVTLTATVSSAASTSTTVPTGTVTFFDGTKQLAIGTLNSTGSVSVTLTFSGGVAHTLTAVYSGDTNYAASSSNIVTISPTLFASAMSFTSNVSNPLATNSVIFTVQLSGAGGLVPTGVVTLYDNFKGTPSTLGAISLGAPIPTLSNGTLSLSTLQAGVHSIYAVYPGDSNFAPITSYTLLITVSDYTTAFSPTSLTLTQGAGGQFSAVLTPVSGFAGTVAFGCIPPSSSEMTCSVAPAVLTTSGIATISVNTTKSNAAVRARAATQTPLGLGAAATAASLAMLLCGFFPGRHRRWSRLLLLFAALAIAAGLGCGGNSVSYTSPTQTGGTPLGTGLLTITSTGTMGTSTVSHNYSFSVTVQ
jgi:hypothetical protein